MPYPHRLRDSQEGRVLTPKNSSSGTAWGDFNLVVVHCFGIERYPPGN